MQHAKLSEVKPRWGEWGPDYLIKGDSSDIGLLTLRPGDAMPNHIHRHCDESFVVIEGRASLWIDCAQRYDVAAGDVYRCPPEEMHYFVNDSDAMFTMVFIKSPAAPGDTIEIPWSVGEPAPPLPAP